MNRELLRFESDHVRIEYDKLRELNGTVEKAVEFAARAFVDALSRLDANGRWATFDRLPGTPPDWDAPISEWVGYFAGHAEIVHHDALFEANTLEANTLVDVA